MHDAGPKTELSHEHGDYGDEGPKDYESMSTLEKDAMLDELAGQIGNDLKNIASLC
jgi:hypothetical protein